MGKRRREHRMTFDPAWSGSPFLVSGGFDHPGGTISLEPHAHAGFELTYISEGEVTWVLEDGAELRLTGGTAALIGPGVAHHGRHQVISPSRLFWLVFDPSAAGAEDGTTFSPGELEVLRAALARAGNTAWQADEGLRRSFELLRDALAARADPAQAGLAGARCRTAACQLVLDAVRSLGAARGRPAATGLVARARRILEADLASAPGVPELARRLGLGATLFSARFKAESGLTPADYLRRLRCERACALLEDGRLSVTGVALQAGFATSQHFAGVFRRYLGVSPRQYRRRAAARRSPA